MASSQIEICNRALGRIGIDQLIESIDDPNNRARECRLHYEPCRDEVLQDFPWNFAQRVVALAPVSAVEVPGFTSIYRYPANALKIHRITGAGGITSGFGEAWATDVWNYDILLPTKTPFQVMADPVSDGARVVVTVMPSAFAWHTTRVTDPSQFSPLFRSALAWRMAMELALALRASDKLYNNAAQQYGWAVSQAQAGSLNEEQTGRYPVSPAVSARA